MASSRRTILRTLGGGGLLATAGCFSTGDTGADSTPTTSTGCSSERARRVTVTDVATPSSGAALSLTATTVRERVSADAPARIRTTLTNDGPAVETRIRDEGVCHLFNRSRGRSTPAGLWLYRSADAPTDREPGCWTRDASSERPRTFVGLLCGRRRLPPGESVTTTYEVWADYATRDCYPTGDYRFRNEVPVWRIGEADEATDRPRPDRLVDCWIDLTVTGVDP